MITVSVTILSTLIGNNELPTLIEKKDEKFRNNYCFVAGNLKSTFKVRY